MENKTIRAARNERREILQIKEFDYSPLKSANYI